MSLASHPRAYWRGGLTCLRAIAMLTGMVALLVLQGHAAIAAGIALTQGSYRPWSKYSANTHAGCGVVDIARFSSVTGKLWTQSEWAIIVAAARQVGFAAWHRFAIKGLWVEHAHLVAIGCPDLNVPDATNQVAEYLGNHDGLMGDAPDNGPRNWVNVTWERYSAMTLTPTTAKTQEDDEDMTITVMRSPNRLVIVNHVAQTVADRSTQPAEFRNNLLIQPSLSMAGNDRQVDVSAAVYRAAGYRSI